MVIAPSDSSRKRSIMSKYIPGNQKHLTLEDRVYIENELAKGTSFKNIAAFLCNVLTAFLIGITKELFIMPETFAPIVTIVKRPMSVERYFFVVLNVLPVQHAIRPVEISRKNAVKGLIKLHMYVTDVLRR